MRYYSENDNRPYRWAAVWTAVYAVVLGCLFFFVKYDIEAASRNADEIVVEFVEPEPEPEPQPPRPEVAEPQMHDNVAAEENEQQVSGQDKDTRTVNPRALFRMAKSGSDEPENAGNPKAKEDETDSARGDGGGLNPVGTSELDAGLKGRGLKGELPNPIQPPNKSGKVVIRVRVDQYGKVIKADYEPKGSTSSDRELIEAAREAAFKTTFAESKAYIEGGTITYYFKLT